MPHPVTTQTEPITDFRTPQELNWRDVGIMPKPGPVLAESTCRPFLMADVRMLILNFGENQAVGLIADACDELLKTATLDAKTHRRIEASVRRIRCLSESL